ncbi:MAG: long-chain fatty acid--CoA ligase [Bradymonadales bacterium]|nr:long-chain fatty acid--CoA ligase [Bradymonadales bacterium]
MIHGSWLAKWAPVIGNKAALVDADSGHSLTYAQLDRRADQAARLLADRFGVQPGDRVALLGANRIEQVELFFAVAKLGAILVPINWRLTAREVAHILEDSSPRVLFFGADVAGTVQTLAAGLWPGPVVPFDPPGLADGPPQTGLERPLPSGERAWPASPDDPEATKRRRGETPVALDEQGCGAIATTQRGTREETAICVHQSYAHLRDATVDDPVVTEEIEEDTPLMLLYTSGTTGRPKGAILTHGTVTWNAINTATSWDLHQDDVTLTHTPFFHTGGWNVLTLPLLHRGGTVVLMPGFDATRTIRALERYRGTILFAVPTMFQMMLECEVLQKADLGAVRFFVSGGAACPLPLIEAYQARGIVFKQGYGLTEVGPNCFALHPADAICKAGSVGFPVLHLDTRIVDAGGTPVRPGEVGELQLRGPTVSPGYWNDPRATRSSRTGDGWFTTGDLFRQDEEGYHYVVGRLKEMYISGGENIYPAEVEGALYRIPGVIEAASVGVPDLKWGEVGHAFLAFEGGVGAAPSTTEIIALLREELARYKVPKYLTVLESLPKGPSGKILRTDLVQRALAMRNPA